MDSISSVDYDLCECVAESTQVWGLERTGVVFFPTHRFTDEILSRCSRFSCVKIRILGPVPNL